MQVRNHARDQIVVTLLSVAFLSAMAVSAPRFAAHAEDAKSFVGTSPQAMNEEPQPPTF